MVPKVCDPCFCWGIVFACTSASLPIARGESNVFRRTWPKGKERQDLEHVTFALSRKSAEAHNETEESSTWSFENL